MRVRLEPFLISRHTSPMINQAINSEKVPDGASAFHPHARRVGDLLFVSGTIARKKDQSEIPGVTLDANGQVLSYDIEVQTRATIDNLRSILEAAGTKFENIVDVTVFLTNIKNDFQAFNRVYGESFKDILPSRTTVEVSRFPSPVAIEIKVIAVFN